MHKILSTLIAVFLFSALSAQIRGITITGIKGIKQPVSSVIANERTIPTNYKVYLRPELEGPVPKGQYPGSKPVSKFGSEINASNISSRETSVTQSVYSNFLTIWGSYASVQNRESPYTPPDNCGDVGTTQIIATANTRMKVFTKPTVTGPASTTPTGTSTTTLSAVVNLDLNVFFTNPSLGINSISDPHVRFDRLSGRWFIVAIEVNHTSGSNYCCVAVSDGPTVTSSSNFTKFYFSVVGTGGAANDFFDYPTLGVDKTSLYIGGNMFANGSSFSGSNMWVLNKASLLAGSLTVTSFPHGTTHTDMYTPQGVHNDDPGATNGYFIGASQTAFSKLVIRRVSYSPAPTLSGDLALATSTTYTPKGVPTLGGTTIDGNDRRICAAMIKKNKITGTTNLWVAQGTLLNKSGVGGSGGDRDGALWLEIGNLSTTPSILQSASLYDGVNATASAVYYTYPTIALSGQGHNVMGFTSAGPKKSAQASAAGRYRTDPAGVFQAPADFTTTTSSYNPGASRWGDFTQTVVDPSDDMTMWTFTEYVPTTNAWGVRAGQFKAPPPATPVLASTPACGTTSSITINGTSTNNSEFFDPGADAGGPGFTRLTVGVTGPSAIGVSNVVFVNPTKITASFNVPANAASGTYTVTITNPDGQTSTTTFTLNCAPPPCGSPTGLTSSPIDNNDENVSWSAVTNANNYDVDYSLAGQNSWTSVVKTTVSTSVNIGGLAQGTNYDWRVRANCSNGSSTYSIAQFTTTAPCDPPTGLTSSSITTNSAAVSWSAVSGGNNYDVDYSLAGQNSWTNVVTATTNLSAPISGLSPSTNYDWRVRAHCASGPSGYSTAQFTTAALPPCNPPTGLTSSSITTNSATVSWSSVSGGNNYDVDYSLAGQNSWTNVVTATTNLSAPISGLSPSTNYDWRVRAHCASGPSGYSTAQFTTAALPPCNPPTGLTSSSITTNSATVSWSSVSGANNYDVDYSLAGQNSWTNVVTATTNLSAPISGLSPSTNYDWRVRANCASGPSGYAIAQFTTAAVPPPCDPPTGLTSSAITSSSATVSWSSVSGANNYDVDYSLAGQNSWTNAATATTSLSKNITGLAPSTNYDWRVRANCASGPSGYSIAQFTTAALPPCNPPTGLTSSAITSSSATVSWSSVSGANNYDVDYSLAGQNSWTNAATATTSLSKNITGLAPSTNYDWRVRANCASGPSGYSIAQFTTAALPPCNPPAGLTSSAITSSSATVSWGAVSGANNYDVDYSLAGQNSWTNAVTGTTSTSKNITGLAASTAYDWRVRANCASGPSGYSIAQFTTTAVVCPDQLEPNESLSTAKAISTGVNINAQIASATDKDFYSFSTTSTAKNIKVTLTNLPANYDLTLYSGGGIGGLGGGIIGSSAQPGTSDETIVYNTSVTGIYKVSVLGATASDFNSTQCYTLKVLVSSATFTANIAEDESNNIRLLRNGLKLYPIPASTAVTISFDAYAKGNADIVIINQLGQQVLYKKVLVSDGINFNTIDVSGLINGVYTLKVNNGKEIQTQKMIINK